MKIAKSVGIVLFRKKELERQYLLLKYNTDDEYWGFAKGTPEGKETEEETALREIKEETDLEKLRLIKNFKEPLSYYFTEKNETFHKTVIFFLAEVLDQQDGKISHEHQDLRWLTYQEALALTTYKNDKKLLTKAEEFLKS